jgi:hypothetical protein
VGISVSARQIQAVIAAGLADPKMLYSWIKNPELLRPCGINPSDLDLEALWRFSGLTTKVRHNDLRRYLPMTFALLSNTGLEFEIFADYAIPAAEMRAVGKNTISDKLQALFEFIQGWLDLRIHNHALLWHILQHEITITQIRNVVKQGAILVNQRCENYEFEINDTPIILGMLRLLELSFDPRSISNTLRRKPSELSALQPNPLRIGYWREGDSPQISLLDLDEYTFHILRLIDGSHSIRDIAQALAGQDNPLAEETILGLMRQLADIGLLAPSVSAAE